MERAGGEGRAAGLCDTCAHVRLIRSDRGSVFFQCLLAARDPEFPKYPQIPVVSCRGYSRGSDTADTKDQR